MPLLTDKQQRDLLIGAGLADFVTRGRITAAGYDALKAIILRGVPPTSRFTGRAALGVGKAAARRTPAIGMALTGYEAYERGRRDAEMGLPYALQNLPVYPLMQPGIGETVEALGGPEGFGTLDVLTPALKVRKKVSKYAKNVGKAMKAVKASAKGGPKGKISNPKTTFKTVSKTVSKIMKGGTRPRTGIGQVISRAVKGSFKKKRQKRKRPVAPYGLGRKR